MNAVAPGRLEARDMHVAFSGVVALQDVTMTLDTREILGLIGPNGAGKTTMINVLSGFVSPQRGEMLIDGEPISNLAAHRRPELGLARTFQSVRLFARLTVAENIEAAALARGLGRRQARSTVRELLDRMQLAELRDQPASHLSHGAERRVGLARALALAPRFLLLDEPAAGMDDYETRELASLLRRTRDDVGLGILVVEHDMALVMSVCDRVQVLVDGCTIAVGTPDQVHADPLVRDAYFGVDEEELVAGR